MLRFVVKTADENDRKVFINICGSDKVPAPGGWANGKVLDLMKAASSTHCACIAYQACSTLIMASNGRHHAPLQPHKIVAMTVPASTVRPCPLKGSEAGCVPAADA